MKEKRRKKKKEKETGTEEREEGDVPMDEPYKEMQWCPVCGSPMLKRVVSTTGGLD